ncbi:MAG: hypothetical protein EOP10_12570 [Proteobacteria bacterium]|nr:MAG: hypothetical protein EOP10_12570 [Pseudomonadota bacterium]
MKTTLQKLLLTLVMLSSGLAFAGQHSGVGGGAPPRPAPEPSWYSTIEEYYNAYTEWLREQMESQAQPNNYSGNYRGN